MTAEGTKIKIHSNSEQNISNKKIIKVFSKKKKKMPKPTFSIMLKKQNKKQKKQKTKQNIKNETKQNKKQKKEFDKNE